MSATEPENEQQEQLVPQAEAAAVEAVAEGEPDELGQQLHRDPGAGPPNENQEQVPQSQVAAPIEQGHFVQQMQSYSLQDPIAQQEMHGLPMRTQQEHTPPEPGQQVLHQEPAPADGQPLQHPEDPAAGLHMQHDPQMQAHSGPLLHPASFAQQMMDPHISQQQLAHYHQQMAQFHPQAYQQHLAAQYQGPLQDVPPLYLQSGMPPHMQQAYQDESGGLQDPKAPDMSPVDEAAAAHLTALRNTGRPDGHPGDGQQQQLAALGQPAMGHPSMHTGMHAGGDAQREAAYGPQDPQAAMAGATGRPTSKRKKWQPAPEGPGAEGEERGEGGRVKRKQTRRPDRLCHHENCFVTPTYNYPGEKKRIFCVTHKLEGMVNVVAKRCAHPGCNVNPRFNYEGNSRGLYCSEHKLDGMINVIDRRCHEPDCKKFPSHNFPGSHKKLYCATHKREGMVDMSHGSN